MPMPARHRRRRPGAGCPPARAGCCRVVAPERAVAAGHWPASRSSPGRSSRRPHPGPPATGASTWPRRPSRPWSRPVREWSASPATSRAPASSSVRHAGGLRTTYEPVLPAVRVGTTVAAGDLIGHLMPGHGDCGPARWCLHWGLLRGSTYLDPLTLLRRGPVRLLPLPADDVAGRPRAPWSGRPRRCSVLASM